MSTESDTCMRFVQYGRTCQLRLETAEDLKNVLALDEALWVATSAPTQAFVAAGDLVTQLDRDGSGRLTSDELRDAVRWFLDTVQDASGVETCDDHIDLSNVRSDGLDGKAILTSARYILEQAGSTDAPSIQLQQVSDFLTRLTAQPLNGDGVIVPEAAESEELAAFIRHAIECVDGVSDASGRKGIDTKQLQAFRDALSAHHAWEDQKKSAEESTTLLPLGDRTSDAHELFKKHADLVDAFFSYHEARRFEADSVSGIVADGDTKFDMTATADIRERLAQLPVAKPVEDDALPLEGPVTNPLYREWLAALRVRVVEPLIGEEKQSLSHREWHQICSALAPVSAYLDSKQGARVEAMPRATRETYLKGALFDQAAELVAQDSRVATIRDGARLLRRLLLCQIHLLRVANNFVSFSELYTPAKQAVFETGSAVFDGRWFGLALEVTDLAAHSATAKASGIFTCYLDVFNADGSKKMTVAVPATSGSRGNLRVGKRGVFFDNGGLEYDARVAQVIDNPISFREALVAPFVRLWSFVLGKIESISAATEKDLQSQTGAILDQKATQPAAASKLPGGPTGLLVGLSVSAAAVGSSLAFIAKTFAAMKWHQLLGGLGTAALIVVLPTSLVAFMKLRRQDLSSLLEGCGWAINCSMRLSREQRYQFTRRPPYPVGAIGLPVSRSLITALVIAVGVTLLSLAYLGVTLWLAA